MRVGRHRVEELPVPWDSGRRFCREKWGVLRTAEDVAGWGVYRPGTTPAGRKLCHYEGDGDGVPKHPPEGVPRGAWGRVHQELSDHVYQRDLTATIRRLGDR